MTSGSCFSINIVALTYLVLWPSAATLSANAKSSMGIRLADHPHIFVALALDVVVPTRFNASSCVAHSLVFGAKDVMDTHSAASAGLTKMSFMVDQKYAVALSQPHNTTTNQRNCVVLWLNRS